MSNACCTCCGARHLVIAARRAGRWSYLECKDCGTFQLSPTPTAEELEQFYNSDYKVDSEGHFHQMAIVGNELLDLLESTVKGRELLEIGCSYGGFLLTAQNRGWSCRGIEISHEAAAIARRSGLKVSSGALEQTQQLLVPAAYDVVIMQHVIEHLPNWRRVLELAIKALNPGGCLVLRTPNADSLGAQWLRGRWEWFHAPSHLNIFSPRAMERVLTDLGLRVEFVYTRRGDAKTFLSQAVTAVAAQILRSSRRTSGSPSQRGSSPPSHLRRLYRSVCHILDVPGRPVDWLLGLNGGSMRGSELLVAGRRSS